MKNTTKYPIIWRKDYMIDRINGWYIISGLGRRERYLYYTLQQAKKLFKNKYIK